MSASYPTSTKSVLMIEWEHLELGEILTIKYGKDHKRLGEGHIPCFGSGGIMRFVDAQLSTKPSVLIPRKGSLNNIFFVDRPFWTVDTLFWTQIDEERAHPKFTYYKALTIDWESMNVGSAVPSLTSAIISGVQISLPSLSEQEAIAEVLSSLDDKIDLLKRQNKTLEGMAEALFRQWFIEEAQDEWPEVQFQEIVKVSRGVSYSGKLLGDDGIPMHNLKSASVGGGYRYDGIKFFQGDVKPEKILSPGEILMVNTDMTPDNRIIGQPIRVPSFYPKSICSHHMYHLDFECSATRTFVYQYFRIEENRELLANYSNGTTVSMLGSKVLKTVEIPLPPIQLREAFMEYRRDIDDKLDSNEMKIRNLTAQRDTLLPKLMSGEVRVQMD